MKKTLLGLIVLGWPLVSQAQLGRIGDRVLDRTQQNAERRLENGINRKIDKTIDNALDGKKNTKKTDTKTTPAANPTPTPPPSNSGAATPSTSGSNVKGGTSTAPATGGSQAPSGVTASPFTGQVTLETKVTGTGAPKHTRMEWQIKPYDLAVKTTDLSTNKTLMRTVYLRQENKAVIVEEEKRTATKIKMPSNVAFGKHQKGGNATVTRTNETKMIEGVACVKYILDDNEQRADMWVDERNQSAVFQSIVLALGEKGKNDFGAAYHQDLKGLPLEVVSTSKANPKEVTYFYVRNLKEKTVDETWFNYSGYQLTDVSNY